MNTAANKQTPVRRKAAPPKYGPEGLPYEDVYSHSKDIGRLMANASYTPIQCLIIRALADHAEKNTGLVYLGWKKLQKVGHCKKSALAIALKGLGPVFRIETNCRVGKGKHKDQYRRRVLTGKRMPPGYGGRLAITWKLSLESELLAGVAETPTVEPTGPLCGLDKSRNPRFGPYNGAVGPHNGPRRTIEGASAHSPLEGPSGPLRGTSLQEASDQEASDLRAQASLARPRDGTPASAELSLATSLPPNATAPDSAPANWNTPEGRRVQLAAWRLDGKKAGSG